VLRGGLTGPGREPDLFTARQFRLIGVDGGAHLSRLGGIWWGFTVVPLKRLRDRRTAPTGTASVHGWRNWPHVRYIAANPHPLLLLAYLIYNDAPDGHLPGLDLRIQELGLGQSTLIVPSCWAVLAWRAPWGMAVWCAQIRRETYDPRLARRLDRTL